MNQRFLQNIYHANENGGTIVRNVIQSKSGIAIYVDVSVKIGKNKICEKKNYIWNPTICSCKNGKYFAIIINESVIKFDKIVEETETNLVIFNEKM